MSTSSNKHHTKNVIDAAMLFQVNIVFILNLFVAIKLPQLVTKCLRCCHTFTEGYFLGTIINSVPSLHPLANVWLIIASHEPHE